MPTAISVTVPATTANLGPGFDCLGAALTLYNRFHFRRAEASALLTIQVSGPEADRVGTDESNLVYKAFAALFHQIGQPVPAVEITIELGIPLARGLGSSSTAIVGGLLGANSLTATPLSQDELVALATELEGHPDNVVPALLGGCYLAAPNPDHTWTLCPIPWHPDLVPVVAVPDFELSTEAARQVLPPHYRLDDAVFNLSHLGLLVRGLETGQPDWLAAALADTIHQPYRQALIPGYNAVRQAALAAGAYGLVISGAGPTLLAIASPEAAPTVAQAMATTWQQQGQTVTVHQLQVQPQGSQVSVQA